MEFSVVMAFFQLNSTTVQLIVELSDKKTCGFHFNLPWPPANYVTEDFGFKTNKVKLVWWW